MPDPANDLKIGVQRIKLVNGEEGTDGGDVTTANPFPVAVITAASGTDSVQGKAAHDSAVSGNPLLMGGYAGATAPSDVSEDGDAVRAWFLRNGSQVITVSCAGALIGGDATNGLDVDVTRLPALPAGTNNIGDVDVLTLPALPAGTNNIGDVDILTQVGAATLANAQVSVDTTSGGVTIASSRATRRRITIVNHGTTDVYVGAGTVSTTNGFLLMGVKGAALTLHTTAAIKGIVGTGSQTVSVLEEYE